MTAAILLTAALTATQAPAPRPEEVPVRYDVAPLLKLYPQATAKLALDSAVKAAEKGRFDYVAAHLLDPAFVDAEAKRRGAAFLGEAEVALRIRRDREKQAGSDVPRDRRLPDEPSQFLTYVEAAASEKGFQRLVADFREKAVDDPSAVKELRRFLRNGTWEEGADTAKVTLRDVKDRAVFLKKVGTRWFVENRQGDEKPVPAGP
jgi:hypothetical protein